MTLLAADDLARRSGLRRMRMWAGGLLLLAAVVFLLTHGRDGAWGYVNATSEAAMVGAIADWFAVTALFRHPLGIPVPHTAIIPKRKDDLARSLEAFFTDNFLTPQTVRERYLDAQVMRRLGSWLADPVNSERVVAEAAPFLRRALTRIGDEDVRAVVDEVLLPRLRREPVSPLAGHLLEAVVADKAHHGLVDIAARELHAWLVSHPEEVCYIIASRAPWWSPQWLDEQIVFRVYKELVTWSAEVNADSGHRVRLALDSYLAQLAQDLQHDEDTKARAERLKERILEHPQAAGTAVAFWRALQGVLVDALDDPAGHLRTRLAAELGDLGSRLVTDDELRARFDAWTADTVVAVVDRYGPELATVISSTIQRWDGRQAAERIELHVGRDLQFIRINGTVVGGLVGLTIHTVAQLL